MKLSSKGIAAIILGSIVVFVAILALVSSQSSTQTPKQIVAITVPAQVTVDVFEASESEEHGTASAQKTEKPVATITQSQELTLTQGDYRVTVRASADVKQTIQRFTLGSQKATLTIAVQYTDQKLKSLLSSERAAIVGVITSAYPQLQNLYTIEEGWLYNQGDWYATKLMYKGAAGSQSDTLRLIAHKEASQWKVVTDPPTIMISSPKYPAIPSEIVTDINNFK